MSAFHSDGPQNVLCNLSPLSADVRIKLTPELTPAPEEGLLLNQSRQSTNTAHGSGPERLRPSVSSEFRRDRKRALLQK